MRPPMRQVVTIHQPTGEKDEHSKPITVPQTSKARVQYTTRTVKGTNGQTYETSLEIDLPAETPIAFGTEIEYTDRFENVTKGQVVSMNEATKLSGTKVFFRTVFVG
jgi:hypothetical protein